MVFRRNTKEYNRYGEIFFKEEVNVSRIKNNPKLLEIFKLVLERFFII
jgi:hypothetical protein